MGALILLLLVTTRRMHNEQQHAAEVAEQVWEDFDDALADTTPTADAFLIPLDKTRTTGLPDTSNSFSTALLPAKSSSDSAADPFAAAMDIAEQQRSHDDLQQQLVAEQHTHSELKQQIADAKLQLQATNRDDSEYQSQMQQLSSLQHQEGELEVRLQHKQLALAALKSELDGSSESTDNAESLLRAQESALVRLRKIAADAEANSAAGTDQTIIEFTNPTGTKRTPILVNVTAQGFEFLPSGIRVTHENMKETPDRYNPLVAGVLAINQYRNPNASSVQPYVLLLVRPDGGSVFYAAKSAFQEFGLHWGYELLEQDHKIASGSPDVQEAEIARVAVLEALSKRFPDFNKYAALKEQLIEELAAKNQSQPDRRSVTMLPDGTMILPGDESAELSNMRDANKRFYAGGHAPRPEQGDYRAAVEALEKEFEDPFEGKLTDADQPAVPKTDMQNPFAILAEKESQSAANKDLAQNSNAGENPAAPFEFPFTMDEPADAVVQQTPGENATESAGSPDAVPFGFSSDFPNAGAEEAVDLAMMDHRTLLRKRRTLSDNMGVGGRQASDEAAKHMAAKLSESTSSSVSTLSRTDPREPTSWADSMTAKHGSATPPAGQVGDFSHTAKPDPFDFGPASAEHTDGSPANNPATADTAAATAAVRATADNSQPFDSTQNNAPPVIGGGSSSQGEPNGAAGSAPGSDEESFLAKFLRKVEEQRAEHRPDPMLVSMLHNARRTADLESQAAKIAEVILPTPPIPPASEPMEDFQWTSGGQQPAQQIAQHSTADNAITAAPDARPKTDPAPAPSAPRQPSSSPEFSSPESAIHTRQQDVFYVIKIHVEQDQLTIGDFEPVDTKDWTSVERLALTLQAISVTMDEVWATARPDAAPAVRFLVDPNAEDMQQELAQTLASMNVPTRGVMKTGSGWNAESFFGDAESADPAQKAAAEPAEPAPSRPRTGRRTSI